MKTAFNSQRNRFGFKKSNPAKHHFRDSAKHPAKTSNGPSTGGHSKPQGQEAGAGARSFSANPEKAKSFWGRKPKNKFAHGKRPNHGPKPVHNSHRQQPQQHSAVATQVKSIHHDEPQLVVATGEQATSFDVFPLSTKLREALQQMNFTTPTPIQSQAIPVIQRAQDLIGCAATGTGKTLAFALPILNSLEHSKKTALVLCPTRELAMQIDEVFTKLAKNQPHLQSCLVIGGMSMNNQVKNLRSHPRVIIATPGRLVDHLNQRTVSLGHVGFVVLDEADRMLDMGFAPQIAKIMNVTPTERQTLLFSATFPKEIQALAVRMMKNPQKIVIGQVSKPTSLVTQATMEVPQTKKNEKLVEVINSRPGTVLIFTRTKHRTDKVHKFLYGIGYPVSRIHGGRSQSQRITAIQGFKENKVRILVATDVASRGIDVSNVGHVINYDLPPTAEDYVHRIGRAGRAGAAGHATSFITPEERGQWKMIERSL